MVGAPVSTALLDSHILGFAGWQSIFILEGLPAIVAGFLVLGMLPDRPGDAKWLIPEDVAAMEASLARGTPERMNSTLRDGLLNANVWQFGFIYFGIVIDIYGFGFWALQIIKSLNDVSNNSIGWLTTIPYFAAATAMVYWSKRSDRHA